MSQSLLLAGLVDLLFVLPVGGVEALVDGHLCRVLSTLDSGHVTALQHLSLQLGSEDFGGLLSAENLGVVFTHSTLLFNKLGFVDIYRCELLLLNFTLTSNTFCGHSYLLFVFNVSLMEINRSLSSFRVLLFFDFYAFLKAKAIDLFLSTILAFNSLFFSPDIDLMHLFKVDSILLSFRSLSISICLIVLHLNIEELFTFDPLASIHLVFHFLLSVDSVHLHSLLLHALQTLFVFIVDFVTAYRLYQILHSLEL